MCNKKNNVSHRLLAAFLSFLMVFAMMPLSIVANAATTAHPDAVTITVVDDVTGEPIEGAKVTYVIYDNDLGEEVKRGDDVPTDVNGEVVIFDGSEPGDIKISSITITHDDYATYTDDAYNQAITSLDDNFIVEMTCKKIKDVEISGKTLPYTGGAQKLVSVTEIEGDTIEYYLNDADVPVAKVTAIDAGTYTVRVVVTREGKDPLEKTVEAVIEPADIKGIDIAPVTGLEYNKAAQELVTLTGEFAEGDTVTWTVDGNDEEGRSIPKRMATGSYIIKLTVDRGANYNIFEKTVEVEIAPSDLDLEGLVVEGLEGVYTVEDGIPVAQDAVTVENKGDYKLMYQLDDGDLTANDTAWVDEIPTVTDAGSYIVWVKAVKENYNDADVTVTPAASAEIPYNVYIAKAKQDLEFDENLPSEVTLGENNDYNFTATGENLSGNDIEYTLVDATSLGVAEISDDGKLTVKKAGIVTVKAVRAGNENYLDAVVYKTIIVKNASTDLVTFDSDSENYVLDEAGIVSEKTATKAYENDNGILTYSIDRTNIGLSIDEETGKVIISNERKFLKVMRAGLVTVVVSADKTADTVNGLHWTLNEDGEWESQEIKNVEISPAAHAEYTIQITCAIAPPFNEVCEIKNIPVNGWYNSDVVVDSLNVDKYALAFGDNQSYGDSITIEGEDGAKEYDIIVKDKESSEISIITIELNFDKTPPEADDIKIEYSTSVIDKVLDMITLGFYNPSVTVKFTAYDATSGIDYFTWNYTKEDGASAINHPGSVTNQKVDAVQDNVDSTKYTGEFTITADEYNQYRGYLSVSATDNANNTSNEKEDGGNVFVVDTISPQMSIKYEGADPYAKEIDAIGNVHYFNGDVAVELTITEANFDSEDVKVAITRDGQPYTCDVTWGIRNDEDQTIGAFTLAGDGDYVVTVNAIDKSGNEMTPYTSETITVDTTEPEIESSYDKTAQNITITIKEHNFRASDITVAVEALDIKGKAVSVKDIQAYAQDESNWSSEGDVHTLVLESTGADKILVDAFYKLTINYNDISGNSAKTEVMDSSLIDHTAPTDVSIEIVTDPIETFLEVITFGFYNPSVTIKFTAYDEGAGVESFEWNYTKENGASDINRATDVKPTTIEATQDLSEANKFTATITLPDTDKTQLRGYLAVLAIDTFGNKSNKVTDDEHIIVVDTIAPKISVEYSKSDRDVAGKSYYNGDVEATIIVNEANFYANDVVVKVSKNGASSNTVTPAWETDGDNSDIHYGKFTITGDGHYIVTVEYTDKSNNFDEVKSTYKSHEITIDTIKPVINVEYQNKNVVNKLVDRDGNVREYFADTQTAVITINEHNFNADEVKFTIVAKDVTGAELNASTLYKKTKWSVDSTGDIHTMTITYPGDANYTFDVEYTDKATNAAKDYAVDYFTVDKTAPTNLKVGYSVSVFDTVLESISFGFYNAKATVTLTAEDSTSEIHSFLYSYLNATNVSKSNAELIDKAIRSADIKYSKDRKTATATFEIPKMVLGDDNQFNGTVEFTATDRSGNTAEVHKETKRIVVDNIAPTAKVSYNEATNVVGNVSYYNSDITATITINESNFYANDVKVKVSKDGRAAREVTPTWKNINTDIHVGTFTLTDDGDYVVTIDYTDKSSNKMVTYTSKKMTIDTKIEAPTYAINDVAKTDVGGAYKGDVKVTFNFADQNFDTNTIKLTRTRFNNVEDVTDTFIDVTDNARGGSGSFTIPSEAANDGIYVLKVTMTDKALHDTESEIKFTINRFGSVYEYSDKLADLIKDGGQYVNSVKSDLVITEYNADRLLEGSLQILITRDGENVTADYVSTPEKINDKVEIGESGWYQYVYTIKSSNFEKDGVYKISLTSKYAATDSAENGSSSVPENSIDKNGNQILDVMSFTVDSVAPEIRNIINLDKAIAAVENIVDGKLNVKYTIVDIGGLKTIEILVNGNIVQTLTAEDVAENAYNFTGSFDLEEQNGTEAHKVQIRVTDLAGNVTDTNSEEFLKAHSEDNENSAYVFFNEITVSRNFFVRWYATPALFWGSIAGVAMFIVAICLFVATKKNKKEKQTAK